VDINPSVYVIPKLLASHTGKDMDLMASGSKSWSDRSHIRAYPAPSSLWGIFHGKEENSHSQSPQAKTIRVCGKVAEKP
jgi:hypothetical protein